MRNHLGRKKKGVGLYFRMQTSDLNSTTKHDPQGCFQSKHQTRCVNLSLLKVFKADVRLQEQVKSEFQLELITMD